MTLCHHCKLYQLDSILSRRGGGTPGGSSISANRARLKRPSVLNLTFARAYPL